MRAYGWQSAGQMFAPTFMRHMYDYGTTPEQVAHVKVAHSKHASNNPKAYYQKRYTVEDVVITHMHYDHAGNLELFPKARFHIQDSEMEFVTGRAMTHKALRHSFVLRDVQEMIAMLYGDRVVFHDGDEGLYPGIELYHVPGHTRGLQCVRVHTKRGWVVLASDVAHYYESITEGTPFLTHENMFQMLEGFKRLRTLAPSDKHIVPGHDPLVMQRYPAPSQHIKLIGFNALLCNYAPGLVHHILTALCYQLYVLDR